MTLPPRLFPSLHAAKKVKEDTYRNGRCDFFSRWSVFVLAEDLLITFQQTVVLFPSRCKRNN